MYIYIQRSQTSNYKRQTINTTIIKKDCGRRASEVWHTGHQPNRCCTPLLATPTLTVTGIYARHVYAHTFGEVLKKINNLYLSLQSFLFLFVSGAESAHDYNKSPVAQNSLPVHSSSERFALQFIRSFLVCWHTYILGFGAALVCYSFVRPCSWIWWRAALSA